MVQTEISSTSRASPSNLVSMFQAQDNCHFQMLWRARRLCRLQAWFTRKLFMYKHICYHGESLILGICHEAALAHYEACGFTSRDYLRLMLQSTVIMDK